MKSVLVTGPTGYLGEYASAARRVGWEAREFALLRIVPRTFAPFAGAVTAPVGRVLSTRIVIAAEVKVLPALSVAVTRRSTRPSGISVVSKLAAWFVQVPAPAATNLAIPAER